MGLTKVFMPDMVTGDLPFSSITGAPVNVLDFGAKGDGVTNDALAIIAAQNTLPNGGILYFPRGTYMIGQAIPLKKGIHYLGESPQSTTLKATANSWDNILGYGYPTPSQAADETYFIIENLTIDGNKAARTENQLQLYGTKTGTFIEQETVTSSSGGTATLAAYSLTPSIMLEPSTITGSFNVGDTVTGHTSGATLVISSKGADDAYQINIRCQSATNFRITNCDIINSFFTALSIYNNCVESTVDNCKFYNNNKSGTVLSSAYDIYIESYGRNLTVFNNIIASNLGNAITARGGVLSSIHILNNSISNSGNYGVEVQSNSLGVTSDIHIIGNRFYAAPNGAADQITVIGNASPAVLKNVTIVGNTFDTGQYGIGIRQNVTNFSITGNVFKDITVSPISISPGGAGTPTSYQIAGNIGDDPTKLYPAMTINGTQWIVGSGSPEGVYYANIGCFYSRTDGGAGTSFYVKEANNGTPFGWVGK